MTAIILLLYLSVMVSSYLVFVCLSTHIIGRSHGNEAIEGGFGSGVEPVSSYPKVACLIPLVVCML